MPLEIVNYLGDLDPANPTGADSKAEGDDHLRNLKRGLINAFPGYTGSVAVCGVATSQGDIYALAPPKAMIGYTANTMIVWRPNVTNTTTAPTLNISGLGARAIRAVDGSALVAGDLQAGQFVVMFDTGTEFRLVGLTKNYIDNLAFQSAFPTPPATGGPYMLAYQNGTFQYITTTIPGFLLFAQGIL